MSDAESANPTESLWGRVWDTLDLPTPRFRRFESLAQWAAWEEWQVYRRRRESAGTRWVLWEFLYPRDPDHPVASPDISARLRRWMELESQSRPEAPPAFSEVTALRALDFLREIERRCRDSANTEERAVCLTVQAMLLGRALGPSRGGGAALRRDLGARRGRRRLAGARRGGAGAAVSQWGGGGGGLPGFVPRGVGVPSLALNSLPHCSCSRLSAVRVWCRSV